jgi:hypothetical protein
MNDEHPRDDEPQPDWPQDVVVGVEGGVRVFWLQGADMQGLVDRLALVLSEHMASGDELHVTYNAMQSGWQEHPGRKGSLVRAAEEPWTELRFEYSAFVILRGEQQ